MHKVRLGLGLCAIVVVVGVTAWAIAGKQGQSAEATVTEACDNIAVADSFDVILRSDFEWGDYRITEARYSGAKEHIITRDFQDGAEFGIYFESIYDGAGTTYWRTSDRDWQSGPVAGQDSFPFTRESLCPDLSSIGSITSLGEETIDGTTLRKYALDTTGFD